MVDSRDTFFPFEWFASAPADRSGPPDSGRGAAPPAALTDEALVRRVASGDEPAFAELAARYERRLAQFVRWWLDVHDDMTEDVVQEVLLQLHRSAPRFGGQSSFRTWLYALARNVCRHQCRKLRRQPARMGESEEYLREIPDARLGPLEALAHDEAIRAVRRAVDALPAAHRLVLMLRDWEELSYAEIADVLGIPVGTVRSRLHNARALLADRLARRGFNT